MLEGTKDGRKRTIFTLINYFKAKGISNLEIRKKIYEWNKKNTKPLSNNYVEEKLKDLGQEKENTHIHNCKLYYEELGVCKPDNDCAKIKNPIKYKKFGD